MMSEKKLLKVKKVWNNLDMLEFEREKKEKKKIRCVLYDN